MTLERQYNNIKNNNDIYDNDQLYFQCTFPNPSYKLLHQKRTMKQYKATIKHNNNNNFHFQCTFQTRVTRCFTKKLATIKQKATI